MGSVEDKIIGILKNIVSCDSILPTSNLVNDIGINSIQFIQMIVQIENEFNIEFDNEFLNINRFENITSISNYVMSKVG